MTSVMTLYVAVFKRSMLPRPELPPAMFEGVWLSSGMRGIPKDTQWFVMPLVQSQRLAEGGNNIFCTPPSCHSPKKFKLTRVWTESRWEIEEYRLFTSESKDEQLIDRYKRIMVRQFHLNRSMILSTRTHMIDPHRVQITMQTVGGTDLYQHSFTTLKDIKVGDIMNPVRQHLADTHKISSRVDLRVVKGMGDCPLCNDDVIFQCGRQMLLDDITSGRFIEKWGPLDNVDARLSVTRGSIDELLKVSASSDINNGPRGRLMYAAVNNWGKYMKPMIRLDSKTAPSQLRVQDHWFTKRRRQQPGTCKHNVPIMVVCDA
jgi:hypothetical protein